MNPQKSAETLAVQAEKLKQYHEYLNKHYKSGVERFFSPTGSLADFQRHIKVSAKRTRDVVIAKGVDDACLKLQPAVEGCDGVFDLSSEPGSGKTSVLPFKFPSKRVVVALPTPFDTWSAYQMATGDCMLKLKGLRLGKEEKVCYMDSYLAANMVLSGFQDYDILIVDECDSGKGVTKFLADVKVKDKLIIRMSASHGRTSSGPSSSFQVSEDNTLPDARESIAKFASAAKERLGARSLVVMPDAQSAQEVAALLPGSKLVTSASGLETLPTSMVDQTSDCLFVSDDVCARGLNLNLDVMVDSQLVTEHGVTRNITKAELYQRKGRVGRNKPGWYVSPGLPTIELHEPEADVLRSNIMRSLAGIKQRGPEDRHISEADASKLLCSSVEPITIHRFGGSPSPPLSDTSGEYQSVCAKPKHARKHSSSSTTSEKKSRSSSELSPPGWMKWFVASGAKESIDGKSYYVSEGPAYEELAVSTHRRHSRAPRDLGSRFKKLAVAPEAPYAVVPRPDNPVAYPQLTIPTAPPIVDLTEINYHMDWPAALRDCVERGDSLPSIVPPGNWRHTSTGGMGTNWYARLEALSIGEFTFVESEFEVVCRAWNKLVASAWVKRTPGLSSLDDEHRLEFCIRYFQSYYNMLSL